MIIKIRQRYTTQTSSFLEVRYQELVVPIDALTRKKPNGPNITSGQNSPAATTHRRTGARNQTTEDVTAEFSKSVLKMKAAKPVSRKILGSRKTQDHLSQLCMILK